MVDANSVEYTLDEFNRTEMFIDVPRNVPEPKLFPEVIHVFQETFENELISFFRSSSLVRKHLPGTTVPGVLLACMPEMVFTVQAVEPRITRHTLKNCSMTIHLWYKNESCDYVFSLQPIEMLESVVRVPTPFVLRSLI